MATTMVGERQAANRTPRLRHGGLVALIALTPVAILAGIVWLIWRAHACLPQLDGTVQLPGLAAPIEILRDARGVPHIRAQSLVDLAFAQGYVTAQDRLWQMDLSRRLARGELSEIFGGRTLQMDIENRRLGFPQLAERGVEELDTPSQRILTGYARGVNAFISDHLNRLPIEFLVLHYRPRPWNEADSIGVALNMAKMLNTSWRTDLMRERFRSKLTPQLYADLFPDRSPLDRPVAEPVAGPTKVAHPGATGALMAGVREPGCAEAHPHERTLRRFASEYAPAGEISTTECERRVGPAVGKERLPNDDGGMAPQLDPTLLALTERDPEPDYSPGSNNWVLSGAHTRSGKPLLSNDPHLGHTIPSIWYQLELEAPGFHVAGVTFPGGPLVVIGHNERIAWGMTNTGPDVQDIYLETFKPDDPNKYLVNGKWVDAAVRQERINVRRARDVTLTVRSTRHGPVIGMDGKYAMALKWTVLQPHAFTFPFLKIDQAQNWQEFTEALRYFISPEQNMVYADADGNIGYYAPAWVPIRKHGDGSVPVRGDIGDDEWTGYVPFQDLPHSYNPPEGIIATANSRVVPEGYPYFITHTWAAPWRTARIFRLLEAGTNFTVEDMLRIDMDVYSLEDVELTRNLLIAGALRPPERPELKLALSLLREWDGNAYADSRATLICEITRAVLLERLLRPKLGDDATHYHWSLGSTFVNDAIHNNWTRWLPPGDADFNVTLMRSLEQALSRISKLVGSDKPFDWKWGTTIPLTFRHPLDAFPLGTRILDVGPFPQMGMATTVKATTATSGPSMRLVIDFGNLDDSVNNITLGESGQVFSPYYGDQFSAWYTGRSFPMLFSDAAVISGAVHKLVLEPAK